MFSVISVLSEKDPVKLKSSENDLINSSRIEPAGRAQHVGYPCPLPPEGHWRTDACWGAKTLI